MAEDSTKSVRGFPVTGTWRKSSYSNYNGSCVEVADLGSRRIGVRDTKAGPGSPVLVFGQADWAAFLGTLKR
jgi:hypothetical protein